MFGREAQIRPQRIINRVFGFAGLGDYDLEFCRVLIGAERGDRHGFKQNNGPLEPEIHIPFQNCSGSRASCSISRARTAFFEGGVSEHSSRPLAWEVGDAECLGRRGTAQVRFHCGSQKKSTYYVDTVIGLDYALDKDRQTNIICNFRWYHYADIKTKKEIKYVFYSGRKNGCASVFLRIVSVGARIKAVRHGALTIRIYPNQRQQGR